MAHMTNNEGMRRPFAKVVAGVAAIALSAAMLPASALALQPSGGELAAGAVSGASPALATQASKAAKNKAAHKAYLKKLKKLVAERNAMGKYRFMDVTGDGIDEMITMWWPTVYTYNAGKVKTAFSADYGLVNFVRAYRAKKVIMLSTPDHALGATYSYLKWNGSQFVYKVSLYTPNKYGKQAGYQPNYYINAKGKVSKKAAKAYVKKLVGTAKAAKITYKEL